MPPPANFRKPHPCGSDKSAPAFPWQPLRGRHRLYHGSTACTAVRRSGRRDGCTELSDKQREARADHIAPFPRRQFYASSGKFRRWKEQIAQSGQSSAHVLVHNLYIPIIYCFVAKSTDICKRQQRAVCVAFDGIRRSGYGKIAAEKMTAPSANVPLHLQPFFPVRKCNFRTY